MIPEARYLAGAWGNAHGGVTRGARYEGFARWSLLLDFERTLGWRGGEFEFSGFSYHGGAPSEMVGVFHARTVSGNEAAISLRFFEILIRQRLWNDSLVVELGQLAADDEFFVANGADELINGTWGLWGLARPVPVVPMHPLASPGAYVQMRSGDERFEGKVGVYSAQMGEDVSSSIGFDYDFSNGALVAAEFRTAFFPFDLKGSFAMALLATNAKLPDFSESDSERGNVGGYLLVEQLLVKQLTTRPGLSWFARAYASGPTERTYVRNYFDTGFELTRPFSGRDHDVAAVGVSQARFSHPYLLAETEAGRPHPRSETIIEVLYRAQVTGWMTMAPDLQIIIDPHSGASDAFVLGWITEIQL